eukprot:CAMPEP_0114567124 /NCGR_PEP_ID=MMETSP0114-20121206/15298_1 /TAXON_ID=31324 /ORGANISM="Goniomonas sp, Strain m" /LENGTH=32 /DNA_ID= /DNA_START= /DNA_END= /DNA_ORIENTATION=
MATSTAMSHDKVPIDLGVELELVGKLHRVQVD